MSRSPVVQSGCRVSPLLDVNESICSWLWRESAGERIEARRYAAVLILRELTKVAPAFVYDHVAVLLDNLWTALRDPKVSRRSL